MTFIWGLNQFEALANFIPLLILDAQYKERECRLVLN